MARSTKGGAVAIPHSLGELRGLTDEQVIEAHDQEAEYLGGLSVRYWLAELQRRDQDMQTRRIVNLTWAIAGMTGVMTVATIVNVILFYR